MNHPNRKKPPPCSGCDGTGKVEDARQRLITCPTCGGAGTVERGR